MRWGSVLLGLAAAVLGIGLLTSACSGPAGVEAHIRSTYERGPDEDGGRTYTSDEPPDEVAGDIAQRWRPAERVNDPSGYFLRYRSAIVAVTGAEGGGSRVWVDDERRGYARWYPIIGGRWGTYSGPGETFRGGGPGAGK